MLFFIDKNLYFLWYMVNEDSCSLPLHQCLHWFIFMYFLMFWASNLMWKITSHLCLFVLMCRLGIGSERKRSPDWSKRIFHHVQNPSPTCKEARYFLKPYSIINCMDTACMISYLGIFFLPLVSHILLLSNNPNRA